MSSGELVQINTPRLESTRSKAVLERDRSKAGRMLEPFGQLALARLLTRATLQSEKRLPFSRGCFWLARLLQCSRDIRSAIKSSCGF